MIRKGIWYKMILYLIIATLIMLGIFTKNRSKEYLVFILVVLFLFSALHNPFINGTDTISYRAYYSSLTPSIKALFNSKIKFEYGYTLLNIIVKKISNDYFAFQVVYCALSTLLLAVVIKKTELEDDEKFIFLFVYFCFRYFQNTMEFLRQGIATEFIWICILCFNDDKEDNRLSNHLYTVPAWLFHRSALFNFVLFPIANSFRNKKRLHILIATAVISFILLMLPYNIINFLVNISTSVGGDRYSKYLIDSEKAIRGINFINYSLRWIFVILFSFQKNESSYRKKNIIFVVSCLAIIIGSINAEIFTRMLEYYMIAIYIEIALSYKSISVNGRKIYLGLIYAAFMIILYRNLHTVSAGTYMRYELYPIF